MGPDNLSGGGISATIPLRDLEEQNSDLEAIVKKAVGEALREALLNGVKQDDKPSLGTG